jgi:hypothetical protein
VEARRVDQAPTRTSGNRMTRTPVGGIVVSAAGVWLATAALLFDYRDAVGDALFASNLVVAAILVLLGIAIAVSRSSVGMLSTLTVLLGIWLIFLPYGLDFDGAARWNHVAVGGLVTVVAAALGPWMASRRIEHR